MLTVGVLSSPKHAIGYFAKDNYYTREQTTDDSAWLGRGCQGLGLSGAVTAEAFTALLEGRVAGVQLGRVTADGVQHRAGWDLTFSAPKSVSILSEVYGVEAVRRAHHKAVASALAYAESQYVQARITIGAATFKQCTGNAIFATFTHDVSRELDPALHTHSVVINATQTQSGWRSITPELLFQHQKKLGLVYRLDLARELSELGYTLRQHERDPTAFEIAGVPDAAIRHFSKRSEQIESYFEQNNIAYDTTLAKKIALLTRKAKREVDRDELRTIWRDEASGFALEESTIYPRGRESEPQSVGADQSQDGAGLPQRTQTPTRPSSQDDNTEGGGLPSVDQVPDRGATPRPGEAIRPAPPIAPTVVVTDKTRAIVSAAIAHLIERNFGFTEMQLIEQAASFGHGQIDVLQVEKDFAERVRSGGVLAAKTPDGVDSAHWTTAEAKQVEAAILARLAAGKGQWLGVVSDVRIEAHLEKYSLNAQQADAVRQAALNKDRYFAIQGDPGVGKTTLLKAYKDMLLKNGFDVLAMAPSYQAMSELSSSLKLPGMVVDRYLADPNSHRLGSSYRKQIWLIDEAGMLAAEKVDGIMRMAEARGARIVFVGDHQQLESVGAGRAFNQLLQGGVSHVVLNQRMRQKTEWLKETVDAVMRKDYGQALSIMQANGKVQENTSETELIKAMVHDWLSLDATERQETLIITPTNEQREEVNAQIRDGLRNNNEISGQEHTYKTLNDRMLTEQQKRMAQTYRRGDVVRFNQEYQASALGKPDRISRQEYFEVIGVNTETNMLALKSRADRRVIFVDPATRGTDKKGGLQVYSELSTTLAAGDQIRWLDNHNALDLKRNAQAKVIRAGRDFVRVETEDGRRLRIDVNSTDRAHFEPLYARTVYNVQGATTKKIMALMQSWRINTVNQRSFMVAMTRAQTDATIYANSTDELSRALGGRHGNNTEALTENEFQREKARPRTQQPALRASQIQ